MPAAHEQAAPARPVRVEDRRACRRSALCDEEFPARFKGSPIKRTKRRGWLRNWEEVEGGHPGAGGDRGAGRVLRIVDPWRAGPLSVQSSTSGSPGAGRVPRAPLGREVDDVRQPLLPGGASMPCLFV